MIVGSVARAVSLLVAAATSTSSVHALWRPLHDMAPTSGNLYDFAVDPVAAPPDKFLNMLPRPRAGQQDKVVYYFNVATLGDRKDHEPYPVSTTTTAPPGLDRRHLMAHGPYDICGTTAVATAATAAAARNTSVLYGDNPPIGWRALATYESLLDVLDDMTARWRQAFVDDTSLRPWPDPGAITSGTNRSPDFRRRCQWRRPGRRFGTVPDDCAESSE